MFTVSTAEEVPVVRVCSLSTTCPRPANGTDVLGATSSLVGTPATIRPENIEPDEVALITPAWDVTVLLAVTRFAVIRPPNKVEFKTSAVADEESLVVVTCV